MATTIYSQVKLATTENINLSATISPGVTKIDGVVVNANDRILVKAQTNKWQNGIYQVNSLGVWTRASDFNVGTSTPPEPGSLVFVTQGELFADSGWIISSDSAITIGTTDITFERVTLNTKIKTEDIPSGIVLRSEKGYPLTNTELDNNFKFLVLSLNEKLDKTEFTGIEAVTLINSLTAAEANLNAFKLRDAAPSQAADANTIAKRTSSGDLVADKFIGNLQGNADTATLATSANLAQNVTGTVAILNGGTGASTAAIARVNLRTVCIDGDTMVGKLTLAASTAARSPLNVPTGIAPSAPTNGDVWTAGEFIQYRLNNQTHSVARINSPAFTGTPSAPTAEVSSSSTTIATTAFVKAVKAQEIDPAIALKANINSPIFTGAPQAPTPEPSTNGTILPNTFWVRQHVATQLTSYYSKQQIDGFLTGYYTKPQIDGLFTGYYTKAQTDNLINNGVGGALTNYYTKIQSDANIANAVAPKANTTYVDSLINNVYTKTETDTRISAAVTPKADKTYVDNLQNKWDQSRKFVQSDDPGSAAVDGDFWFKI